MKGLIKLPSEAQNANIALMEREFVEFLNGEIIASGTVIRAINSDNVEVTYCHEGEKEWRYVTLNISNLHYYGATRTGFNFGPPKHDYSELK